MLPEFSRAPPRYTCKSTEQRRSLGNVVELKNCAGRLQVFMITVREVAEKDIIPLAEFLPTGLPFKYTTKKIWLRRFQIWWTQNPAFMSQILKGWILENDAKLVGFIGNIPVKFLMCGEIKTAVAAVSWYVDPSIRGLPSLMLFNEYLKQKNASLFLFNSDNKNLLNILIKNKFKEYFVPRFQKKYFYILNRTKVEYILREFLFSGSFPRLNEVSVCMTRLGLLMCAYLYQKPVGALPEKEYTTSFCTFCDDAFSRIWEPSLNLCDVTLSRDTKTLNWIYFSSIEPNKRVVIQCRRSPDNSLAGYMVFDIVRKKTSDGAKMELMDLCLENHDPQVLASLLAFAIEIGKQYNAALLEVWADSQETDMFFQRIFTLRMGAQQQNFFRFPDVPEINSGSMTVCPSMIAPPRGIDHFF